MKTLTLLLLSISYPPLQVNIDPANRVRNIGPGCAYACLDTLGRHLRIKPLIGIRKTHSGPVGIGIYQILRDRGVNCQVRPPYHHKDYAALIDAVVVKRWGAVVSIGNHAWVCVHIDFWRVTLIDPDTCIAHEYTRATFDQSWNGFLIVVRP